MRFPVVAQTGCCRICSKAVEALEGEYLCEDCEKTPPGYDRAACALRFEGHARDAILNFKFNRHLWLLEDLADWLEGAVRLRFDASSVDVVVPMPTTFFHRLDRGYNQSLLLARRIAERLERRFDPHLMKRIGRPRRQSSLSEAERRENVKGTFRISRPEWVRGRTVLLVDDVLTTGSTMSEAARTLKDAGASRVFAAALARSVRS